MVVVQLIGGLGNQMFQYAFGRTLAIHRSDTLFLHLARLPAFAIGNALQSSSRAYGLDVFNIAAEPTTLEKMQSDRADVIWTITEVGCGFFPEVLRESQNHSNLGLIGWWESEKYFLEKAEIIRDDFTFKGDYKSPYPASLLTEISQSDSVCVHLRRTDVLKPTNIKGPLELDYYARGIEVVRERIPAARAFVFSDDIAWCKEHVTLSMPTTFVSSENTRELHPADDLYLMSLCKHYVIANSTYSWWAAWLGNAPEKVVVTPRRWFRNEDPSFEGGSYLTSADLIPSTWIRI